MSRLQTAAEAVLFVFYLMLIGVAWEAISTLRTVRTIPAMLDARVAAVQLDTKAEVEALRKDVITQVAEVRTDIRQIAGLADSRTGEALGMVRSTAAEVVQQAAWARMDANEQLTAANHSLDFVAQSTAALEARYTSLPDEIRADREYQGLVAETMGVLGATKVTMGQAAKTAKVVADEAPKMTSYADKIAGDVTREADVLTKPQSIWSQIRAWLMAIAKLDGAI
jgi:hypothetical protein